jgi:hypothetical protein
VRLRRLLIGACLGALAVLGLRLLGLTSPAGPPLDIELARKYWTPDNTHTVFLHAAMADEEGLAAQYAGEFRGPPLLLQPGRPIHPEVLGELDRLDPCRIVSTASKADVPDEVLQQADTFTVEDAKCNDPRELQRLRELSDEAFERWLDGLQRRLDELRDELGEADARPV